MIKKLRKALKEDEGLYYSWQSNIAMAFMDCFGWYKKEHKKEYLNSADIHTIANDAAKHFLDLLIK